jgi:hypothetical protein
MVQEPGTAYRAKRQSNFGARGVNAGKRKRLCRAEDSRGNEGEPLRCKSLAAVPRPPLQN